MLKAFKKVIIKSPHLLIHVHTVTGTTAINSIYLEISLVCILSLSKYNAFD